MTDFSTVFIDNLHSSTPLNSLWSIFKPFGRITKVHRPLKRRVATQTRYAFVSFENELQASRAVKETNGICVDGMSLTTQLARPLKPWLQKQKVLARSKPVVQPPPSPPVLGTSCADKIWPSLSPHPLEQWAEPPHQEQPGEEVPLVLFPSEVLIPLLDRAITIKTNKKSHLEAVRKEFHWKGGCDKIIKVSPCEFIGVFSSKQARHSFLAKRKWHKESWAVSEWLENEAIPKRVTQVTIKGIPPQAWSENSVRTILSLVGDLKEILTDMSVPPEILDVVAEVETLNSNPILEEVKTVFGQKISTVSICESCPELARLFIEKGLDSTGVPEQALAAGFSNSHEVEASKSLVSEGKKERLKEGIKKCTLVSCHDSLAKVGVINVEEMESCMGNTVQPENSIINCNKGCEKVLGDFLVLGQTEMEENIWTVHLLNGNRWRVTIPIATLERWCGALDIVRGPAQSNITSAESRELSVRVIEWSGADHLVDFGPIITSQSHVAGLHPDVSFGREILSGCGSPPLLSPPPFATRSNSLPLSSSSPTPIGALKSLSPISKSLDNFFLEVVLSPDDPPPSNLPPVNFRTLRSSSSPTPLLPSFSIVSDVHDPDLCYDYGLRMNCHIPLPNLSKQNYAKSLRRSERIKKRPGKDCGSSTQSFQEQLPRTSLMKVG